MGSWRSGSGRSQQHIQKAYAAQQIHDTFKISLSTKEHLDPPKHSAGIIILLTPPSCRITKSKVTKRREWGWVRLEFGCTFNKNYHHVSLKQSKDTDDSGKGFRQAKGLPLWWRKCKTGKKYSCASFPKADAHHHNRMAKCRNLEPDTQDSSPSSTLTNYTMSYWVNSRSIENRNNKMHLPQSC